MYTKQKLFKTRIYLKTRLFKFSFVIIMQVQIIKLTKEIHTHKQSFHQYPSVSSLSQLHAQHGNLVERVNDQ